MSQADYEVRPRKKFPWGWVIGGTLLVLFGACSFAFVGMFKNMATVKPINDAFIAEVLEDELPPVSSGIYADVSTFTDDMIAPINRFIAAIGAPEEIGATRCTANSNASTSELSGEFVSCSGSLTYAVTPATLATRWRKEKGDWKLLAFTLNISDLEAYNTLIAEQELDKGEAGQ